MILGRIAEYVGLARQVHHARRRAATRTCWTRRKLIGVLPLVAARWPRQPKAAWRLAGDRFAALCPGLGWRLAALDG